MKKFLLYTLLAMAVAAPSHAAMAYRYADSVTTLRGDAIGAATVTVYLAGTPVKASLYLTPSTTGTAKANPTYTDGYGRYFFYVASGTYDITISGANITTYTIEDVGIYEFTWGGNTPLPETSWDDLVVSASNIGTTAATAPAEVSWKGVLKVYSFVDAGGDFATFGAQMPHGYTGSTDVKPHFHFVLPDSMLPNETVIFRLLQCQSQISEAAGDTSTLYATFTNNALARSSIAASALHFGRIKPNVHLIAGGITIEGIEMRASSVIYGRIERGPGDTHTGAVYLLGVDIHYQRDRFGTPFEYSD